jgi:Ca-activated chloride channel family protein
MFLFRRCCAFLLIAGAVTRAAGQNSGTGPASIQVHSDLALISALVTDRRGAVVTGLDASLFRVYEDGREQVVKSCGSEDTPVSIGLILDTSGSMDSELPLLKQAVLQFVRAGNADDEYFLIQFSTRPRLVLPLTGDMNQITRSIGTLEAGGNTALLDAVNVAATEIRHGRNPRKALLLISDGLDNHSRYTERETKRLISELGVQIYTIDLYERPSGNRYAVQRQDTGLLETISALTGGRSFRELNARKISSVAELMASEIRHQYLLSYVPSNSQHDGRFRRVRVQVEPLDGRKLSIFHRQGYYAPAQRAYELPTGVGTVQPKSRRRENH